MKSKIINHTLLLAILTSILMLPSCSSDDESQPDGNGTNENNAHGTSVTEAPKWAVDESAFEVDITTSMTITMRITGFAHDVTDNDMVAAFAGDECRGTATPIDEEDVADGIFLLNVLASTADTDDSSPSITLRYYSDAAHEVYTSTVIPYQKDGRLGTIDAPYVPTWK